MDLSTRPVFLLSISFFFIKVCHGDEPMDIRSQNIRLLELEIEMLKLKVANCGREQKTKELSKPSVVPSVSFRSFLSNSFDATSRRKIIIFDKVDLNVGGAYNRWRGVFTAPYNGTYIFSMTLANPIKQQGAAFMVHLKKRRRRVIEYVLAGDTSGWNMGGVTTVAYLTSGDSVWVEGENHISGLSPPDRYHTGFSGALVNYQ